MTQRASRRLTAATNAVSTSVAVLLIACASPGMPPGGPPDEAPPTLVRIIPDTNAVNVRADAVLLHFDEVISERPSSPRGGSGSAPATFSTGPSSMGLASIVSISPSDGRERVEWRRTAIEIRPRRGFRANTTYRVTILPGVTDLRGNTIATPLDFVFSTGSDIPTSRIGGVVFDWAAARPAALARVEVFPPEDSTFRWSTRADSSGRFFVRDLAPGTYSIRAWVDADGNRILNGREIFDSSTVTIGTLGSVDLYAYVQDTIAPRIENVELSDSLTLRVRFDRVVSTEWETGGAVTLVDSDSLERPLADFMPRARLDSLRRASADSAKLLADSMSADSEPSDSVPPDSSAVAIAAGRAAATAADTAAAVPAPTFARTAPVQVWAAALESPLAPGRYRLRITGARGLNGIAVDTEREFRVREPVETPPPAPAAATTDTTVRRPR